MKQKRKENFTFWKKNLLNLIVDTYKKLKYTYNIKQIQLLFLFSIICAVIFYISIVNGNAFADDKGTNNKTKQGESQTNAATTAALCASGDLNGPACNNTKKWILEVLNNAIIGCNGSGLPGCLAGSVASTGVS